MTKKYDANKAGSGTLAGWEAKYCSQCWGRVTAKSGIFVRNLGKEPYSLHHECAKAFYNAEGKS